MADPGERPQTASPLVGRTRELQLLEWLWARAAVDRNPQLVTVFGPPGVGKTRLGIEFARHVAEGGGRTLRGRSLPYRESNAYGAFAAQLKALAGIFESDSAEVAMSKVRELVISLMGEGGPEGLLDHLAVVLGFTPERDVPDRDSLFFSVRCFIEAVAADRPTLFVFEDIHWADQNLLDLIEQVAARLRDLPVLLLTLARPEVLDTRPGWAGGLLSYMAVPLEPLQPEAARELVRCLLGPDADGEVGEQVIGLAETSEGNPLFIEQLAAALTERSATGAALPTTIRGIVSARLDALPAAERAVLLSASVVGRVFWSGLLARAVDPATVPERWEHWSRAA